MAVQAFVDGEAREAHSFQLYPDSEAVLAHWRLSDPYIQEVMEHCTVERLELYGDPSPVVAAGLEQAAARAVRRTRAVVGFARAPDRSVIES